MTDKQETASVEQTDGASFILGFEEWFKSSNQTAKENFMARLAKKICEEKPDEAQDMRYELWVHGSVETKSGLCTSWTYDIYDCPDKWHRNHGYDCDVVYFHSPFVPNICCCAKKPEKN